MAIEISSNGSFGESVRLSGADAESFVREIEHPSSDERRIGHLERSDDAYRRLYSPEPIRELPSNS